MRSVRASPLVLVVTAAGLLLRAAPLLVPGGLTGLQEYDDGVHYAASAALLHGHWPYAGEVFLQPPGIVLLLLPFAALGALTTDPVGLAAARIGVLVVAGVNTLLVASIAQTAVHGDVAGRSAGGARGLGEEGEPAGAERTPLSTPTSTRTPAAPDLGHRRAELAAVLAAGAYAVGAAAVVAAHTVLLEPVLTLFVLLGARRLLSAGPAPSPGALTAAGVLFAAGTAVKLWGVLALVAAVGLLLVERRARSALRLTGAYAVALIVLLAPFAVAAPGGMAGDLVLAQLTRPPSGVTGVPARLSAITGWAGLQAQLPALPVAGGWLSGALLLVLLLSGVRSPLRGARLFGLQGVLYLGAFLLAGPYYLHYGEVLVPAAAILLGCWAARARAQRWKPALAAALAGLAVLSAGGRSVTGTSGQPDLAALVGHVVPPTACVYADGPSLAIAANRLPAGRGCPDLIDPRGVALVLAEGHPAPDLYRGGFTRVLGWQSAVRARLGAASYALLLGPPAAHVEWDAATRAYFRAHFRRLTPAAGPWRVEVWQRVRSG